MATLVTVFLVVSVVLPFTAYGGAPQPDAPLGVEPPPTRPSQPTGVIGNGTEGFPRGGTNGAGNGNGRPRQGGTSPFRRGESTTSSPPVGTTPAKRNIGSYYGFPFSNISYISSIAADVNLQGVDANIILVSPPTTTPTSSQQ